MKVVILGAGFSGLTAGYELAKRGFRVEVYEKAGQAGGAAGGFKQPGWDWYLDFAYHHCFNNEHAIEKLAAEIGFPKFLSLNPETASLYLNPKKPDHNPNPLFQYLFGLQTKSYKLDSAPDLLRFERLNLFDRIRTGLVLAVLKFGPNLKAYDRIRAKDFLTKTMGKAAYQELWEPLFAKKFARFASQINLSFFWARLRRTETLTYPPGGYQALVNQLVKAVCSQGGQVFLNTGVKAIFRNGSGFKLETDKSMVVADKLLNTLASPLFLKLEKNLLPQNYRNRLAKIQYLGAQNLIFRSKHRVLPKTYWLSLAAKTTAKDHHPGLDWMVLVQHTNFISNKHYHQDHLLYLATYTNKPKTFTITDPKIAKDYPIIQQAYIPYAQPLYTPQFAKNKPDYTTPIKNLYFANMELTYPYDRGTNQAVRCGQIVAQKMLK